MATVEQLLAWARGQIGTVEHGGPHGNDGNIVAYWDQIGMHGDQGQPWCAAFTSAAFLAAGVPVPAIVYCPSAEHWYAGQSRLYARNQGQPGDQAFYNFGASPRPGHTGIVESIDVAAGTVTCIEGNTSPGEAGSQSNGGGVYRRIRPLGQVRSFGRPAYATPTPPLPSPNPQPRPEEDMPLCTDPTTGDYWVLTGPEGGVDAYNADGTKGSRYRGNLIDHPQWNAGAGKPLGDAVAITFWPQGQPVPGQAPGGYVIYTRDSTGYVHPYHFDANTLT